MVSYPKILRQAWAITKTHKFLWGLGLFLVWVDLMNFQPAAWQDKTPSFSAPVSLGILVGLIILIVLYFRARAGLIVGMKALIDRQETSFRKAFRSGGLFYQRLFLVSFLLGLFLAAVIATIAIPVGYFLALKLTVRAIILLVIGLTALIPAAVVVTFLDILSSIFITLYDLKIREAMDAAFSLMAKYWPKLLAMGFFIILVTIPTLFFSLFMVRLAGNLLGIGGWIGGIVLFLIVESILAVFTQACWILMFLELVKPVKFEEEEAALPEAEIVQ